MHLPLISEAEVISEVAAILAKGVTRLRRLPPTLAENPDSFGQEETLSTRLEDAPRTVLSVRGG